MTLQNPRLVAVMLSLLVFVIGLSLFKSASAKRPVQPPSGFVITYGLTKTAPGQTPVFEEIQTRFVQAGGNWKQVRYFLHDGGESLTEGAAQGVVLSVGKNSLEFTGLASPAEQEQAFRSEAFHKSHPEFARMDSVVGLPTYVHLAERNGTRVETYFATETGRTPLKTVVRTSDGSQMVTEALSVQFRDVADGEVALPSMPIGFERAQNRIGALAPESAEVLRRQVSEAKQRLSLTR
ncbi:MAG: hypothetical protein AABN34_25995 [Acidobacteriota bacterium]